MRKTRARQFKQKMEDPEYLESSYDRQNKVQKKLKENDERKRVS